MKPTFHTIDNSQRPGAPERRFPITDFNYHSIEISDYNARCADAASNSFRASREYFGNEAYREFLSEAAVFGAMMLTAVLPLLNGIKAIVNLIRATGSL